MHGERDLAWEHLACARELVGPLPPSPTKAMTTATAARLNGLGGEEREAIRLGLEATEMAQALGLVEVQAAALINVGTVRHVTTGDEQGLADLEEGLRLARLVNLPFEVCRAMGNLAAQYAVKGELGAALELWLEAGDEATRYGQSGFAQWFRGVTGTNLYRAGRWDEALRAADAFVAEVEAGSGHYLAPASYLTRGLIRFARDQMDAAQTDIERAVELSLRAADPQNVFPVASYAAVVAQELGDLALAESHARPFLERLQAGRGVGFAITIANVAAWPLTALGYGAELSSCLERYPFPWARAGRAIGEGEPVRAADICAAIGARADEAYARLVAGRAGDAGQLEKAHGFYSSVGATRYVRECAALSGRTAISGA
jgi:tetratricopeptide (TPR) repeat protein